MDIKSVVIHEIKKQETVTGAELFLTTSELDKDNADVKAIISSLDESFSKKTIRRAKFADDGFKSAITDFKNINLVAVSAALAQKLKDGIQNIPAAKGGYLVFCTYKSTRMFLSVFLVRNTSGKLLKRADGKTWDVESIMYLDVDHFAMGVRINLDVLNSESDDRYIHLVKGNTDISDYFENWVGVDDTKQEAKDGDALYEIANKIDLPEGMADRDVLKKQIFDYVNGRPSKIVNLRKLSDYLYKDSDKIATYCAENDLDIDGEFKLSGAQLKKFVKVSVTAGGIKLEASREKFSASGISVSEDGSIVHIRSKELADAIKENL
ncbi:nucleoid-associated protein NdpA [Sulfuriferula multivorans]|uniref:Nucleoid-associated protein NdpA n=1 Tax=Sulfuriferula multivorans TaxID=1559896 RepID=A0A401JAX1_9PROT|nr:nucleoid-associated protein [Sulfuriferula multivorans]GBL44696.1 nucleoid-associated protein NdpA [Sulfuriferula multivorans]